MGIAARKIEVVVGGSSSELLDVLAKAQDALKQMAAVISKVSDDSLKANDATITSNSKVAASYEDTLATVRASGLQVVESVRTQMAAQRELAGASSDAAAEITASADAQAGAAEKAATATVAGADEQKTAYAEIADAAKASAAEQDVAATATGKAAAKGSAGILASNSTLVKWGKATTLALAGAAAGSLYMAAKFNKSMKLIETQAGATHKQVETFKKGILNWAPESTQSPNELSEALYHIVSSMNAVLPAATRTNEELKIMRETSKLASVGNTDVAETAYTVASAMNAYHMKANEANKSVGLLNATVGAGDMTMSNLEESLKSGVLPTAAQFGVSMQSVSAALDVFGDMGLRGAQSGTRLRMMLALLGAPTKAAAKDLEAIGIPTGEVKTRTEAMSKALLEAGITQTKLATDLHQPDGLVVALRDLKDHMEAAGISSEDQATIISRAFGGGRMSAGIMTLYHNLGRVQLKYDEVGRHSSEFNNDWIKSQETLSAQFDKFKSSVEAVAIEVGDDLEPVAISALKGMKDFAEWVDHDKAALEALAALIAGPLTVVMGLFLANRVMKVVEGFKQLQLASQFLRGGFTMPSTATGSSKMFGTGGALGSSASSVGIGGFRSMPGLPGTVSNPIVVVLEDSQYAGMGSEGAKIGGGSAKDAETATATSEATSAESSAAAGGLAGSVKTSLGTTIDRLMKGGMIGALGVFGSQAAGSAIGGSAGKDVSSIGSGASIGAAIGTVIEPGLGTAIGGALGASVGIVKAFGNGAKEGAKEAATHAVTTQYGNAPSSVKGDIDKKLEELDKKIEKLREEKTGYREGGSSKKPQKEQEQHELEAEKAHYEGGQARAEVGRKMNEVPQGAGITAYSIAAQRKAIEELKTLAPQARAEGARAILEWAKGMEEKGDLPKGIVSKIKEKIVDEFPALAHEAGIAGSSVGRAFTAGQDFHKAEEKMNEFINNQKKILGNNAGLEDLVNKQGQERIAAEENNHRKLLAIEKSGDVEERQYAREALAQEMQLKEQAYGNQKTFISQELAAIRKTKHDEGVKEVNEQKTLWEEFNKDTDEAVRHGVVTTKEGTKLIREQWDELPPAAKSAFRPALLTAEKELTTAKEHGGKISKESVSAIQRNWILLPPAMKKTFSEVEHVSTQGWESIDSATNQQLHALGSNIKVTAKGGTANEGAAKASHAATGALMQLGSVGDRGHDSIPLSVGGMPVIAAPGEQVAVFTHQQQEVANAALAPIGGLPGLFSSVSQPHYMAQGGMVGSGGLAAMIREANDITSHHYPYQWGGGHNGSFTGPYDCSGAVSAVLHAGGYLLRPETSGELMNFGQPGPGAVTLYASPSHVYMSLDGKFFGTSLSNPGGGADWFQGGPRAGFTVRHVTGTGIGNIATPKVEGGGALGSGLQAALSKGAGAANSLIQKTLASMGHIGGGDAGEGGGTNAQNEALGRKMMIEAGYPASEWPYLQKLWQKESGWSQYAKNPTSPAYGIPQDDSGQHPYGDNPHEQIAWGLNYIRGRYGTPRAAWAHEMSSNWYSRGGILRAAKGYLSAGKSPKAAAKTKAPHLTKPHAVKKTGKGPKTPSSSWKKKYANIPGSPSLNILEGFKTRITAAEQARSMLGNIEGIPNQYMIMQQGVEHLGPTLVPGEQHFTAGMSVHEGEAIQQSWVGKDREQEEYNNPLTEQGEILSWLGALPSHHLLTGQDLSNLSPAVAGMQVGYTFQPGVPQSSVAITLLEAELALQNGPQSGLLNSDEKLNRMIHGEGLAFQNKMKAIKNHSEKEFKRYTKIKAQIKRLTTGSLKARLSAAKNKTYHDELVGDAKESAAAIATHLSAEKAVPKKKQDSAAISRLEGEKRDIATYQRQLSQEHTLSSDSASVRSAFVALEKNELSNQLPNIEGHMRELTGSTTTVGEGGAYGKAKKYAEQLASIHPEIVSEIETLKTNVIPGLKIELETMRAENANAEVPAPAPLAKTTSGETSQEAALNALLKEELAISVEKLAYQTAANSVFGPLIAQIPHYDRGGPIIDDQLAMVHRGEYVVPSGGTLVSHGSAPNVTVEHHTHVHGNAGALIDLIDSRVTHPKNVREISHQVSQRTNLLSGRRAF